MKNQILKVCQSLHQPGLAKASLQAQDLAQIDIDGNVLSGHPSSGVHSSFQLRH